MQTPMIGNWDVILHHVRPFTIHGDVYYEVHVTRAEDAAQQMLALRIPQHAASQAPLPGETWSLAFLMGQVTEARKIT